MQFYKHVALSRADMVTIYFLQEKLSLSLYIPNPTLFNRINIDFKVYLMFRKVDQLILLTTSPPTTIKLSPCLNQNQLDPIHSIITYLEPEEIFFSPSLSISIFLLFSLLLLPSLFSSFFFVCLAFNLSLLCLFSCFIFCVLFYSSSSCCKACVFLQKVEQIFYFMQEETCAPLSPIHTESFLFLLVCRSQQITHGISLSYKNGSFF